MKIFKIFIVVISIFLIYNQCSADNNKNNNNKNNTKILSLNEIDLLVGTPDGVAEPLDSRRNTITKENKVDYSSFLDDNAITDTNNVDLMWEDAEESEPNDNQVESQLMDLLAETEELEKIDDIYYKDDYEDDVVASTSRKITNKKYKYEE